MASKQDTTQLDLFFDVHCNPRRRYREGSRKGIGGCPPGVYVREKHHNWKGGEVELLCKTCEQPFKVERYRLGHAKYCSMACWKADPDKKSKLHKRIRASVEYKAWRTAVFERDDYTCQMCQKRGGVIQADHIKSFALYPELRFDINNGRTLCLECHTTTDTYGVNTSLRQRFLNRHQSTE